MRKSKIKGFTIVELVIVIAVIAVLAAVLIPTFSNVIEKANKSAVQQAAVNKYKELYTEDLADDGVLNQNKNADGTWGINVAANSPTENPEEVDPTDPDYEDSEDYEFPEGSDLNDDLRGE